MEAQEADYYTRRAEQQLRLAQVATVTAVTNAHYRMAFEYLERAELLERAAQTAANDQV